MARKSTWSGSTVFFKALPTGGPATIATYSISRIISAPSTTTTRSRASPARLDRKIRMASTAETAAPIFGSSPSMAFNPSPVPATLPMLKTNPPTNTRIASTRPAPGRTLFPNTWARSPDIPITRQTFSCTAMSTRIDTRMAKANAAPS